MVRDLHNHAADDGRREMTGMRTTLLFLGEPWTVTA